MRKILASLLAASMVASLGAMSVFAADTTLKDSGASITTPDTVKPYAPVKDIGVGEMTMDVAFTFTFDGRSYSINRTVKNTSVIPYETSLTPTKLGEYFAQKLNFTVSTEKEKNKEFTLLIGVGSIRLDVFEGNSTSTADQLKVTAASISNMKDNANGVVLNDPTSYSTRVAVKGNQWVLPKNIEDLEKTGYEGLAFLTNANGVPYLLVEGTDKLNAYDGVKSAKTVYVKVNDLLTDDDYFKLSTKKGENSKYIKAISVVEKRFNNPLYAVNEDDRGLQVLTSNQRGTFVKIELVELTTDDEYKITFDFNVKVRKDVTLTGTDNTGAPWSISYEAGDSAKIEDVGPIWLKNTVVSADRQFRVGEEGMMLQPVENDENEIIWYNANDDLARLTFDADSDVDKFYSRLSTKWDHQDYATYFADQDAFLFDFIGSPKISSTSRGVLELYNPYIDEDGNETVDPDSIVIYSVVDGELYDITSSFVYDENDDGYMAFTTKTRTLGTYIFAEKPVEEASAEEVPEEVVPGNTTTDTKPVPNTGRF